jgi:hypothetical protein
VPRIHQIWIPLLVLTGIGCTEIEYRRQDIGVDEIGPIAHESWDVNLEISEDGVLRLVLEAAHMTRFDDPDSLYTIFEKDDDPQSRVKTTFYDSLGNLSGTLSAEKVWFNEIDNTMIATGDVVVESDGGQLKSEEVHWDEESQQIVAPGFVSLTTDRENFQGYDFEANEDLSTWSLKKPTGTFTVEE